jgi:hypothetical protein
LETRKDVGHAQDSVTLALCDTIESKGHFLASIFSKYEGEILSHDTEMDSLSTLDSSRPVPNMTHRHPTAKRLVKMINTVKAKAGHVLTSQQQVRTHQKKRYQAMAFPSVRPSICLASLTHHC